MQAANKLMMLTMNVSDMLKAKAFYVDKLGLQVSTDYRQDDDNWWVSLNLPGGGAVITLARATGFESVKPGSVALYFETSDVDAAHKELSDRGVGVNDVQNDLFGPNSRVKFFNFKDPEGNMVHVVQAHEARAPF